MKSVSIRMPEALLEDLREAAARETIRQKQHVSINTLAVEILIKGLIKKPFTIADLKPDQDTGSMTVSVDPKFIFSRDKLKKVSCTGKLKKKKGGE